MAGGGAVRPGGEVSVGIFSRSQKGCDSKTPPEAFRRVRRGVDQLRCYYYTAIIGSVHG